MTYTITIHTNAKDFTTAPRSQAEMESLASQLRGSRFNTSNFPEGLIVFPAKGGGIACVIPSAIVAWTITDDDKATPTPATGRTAAEYSVLGDA